MFAPQGYEEQCAKNAAYMRKWERATPRQRAAMLDVPFWYYQEVCMPPIGPEVEDDKPDESNGVRYPVG